MRRASLVPYRRFHRRLLTISSGRSIVPRGIRDSNIASSPLSGRWESGVSIGPGLSTFTRIFLPFSSLSQARADERRVALLAESRRNQESLSPKQLIRLC